MNTPTSFDGEIFFIRKIEYFYCIYFDLWNFVFEGPFVPTRFIDNEVISKPKNTWSTKEKRKGQLRFQAKYLMTNALHTREFYYVLTIARLKKCETLSKSSMEFLLR